jgi:hypothetical protein
MKEVAVGFGNFFRGPPLVTNSSIYFTAITISPFWDRSGISVLACTIPTALFVAVGTPPAVVALAAPREVGGTATCHHNVPVTARKIAIRAHPALLAFTIRENFGTLFFPVRTLGNIGNDTFASSKAICAVAFTQRYVTSPPTPTRIARTLLSECVTAPVTGTAFGLIVVGRTPSNLAEVSKPTVPVQFSTVALAGYAGRLVPHAVRSSTAHDIARTPDVENLGAIGIHSSSIVAGIANTFSIVFK